MSPQFIICPGDHGADRLSFFRYERHVEIREVRGFVLQSRSTCEDSLPSFAVFPFVEQCTQPNTAMMDKLFYCLDKIAGAAVG